ncbi:nicotinate (nicotinamide) nucleotide adenylyltransferase [Ammoniphilus oxalaticus]|uniref:Probable nicotinate-nucleotide adenylyltransferase n=1 Tax=Ammoniphilus oxalaticus TaxID=66863 RepID=A0A419SJ39_9BACL|nr:nicotinate-nucleotide adenylyltransferase [Ammoniphilus oxalaticus]RKD23966.1 nicotinate (nicotinamide) nucleotide adenylyltransferase [Ammoniphilus oxalaticus]
MKIGILGGTFDPIHLVHLMIAEQTREEADLDEIWFMPSRIPPHKDNRHVTPAMDRLEMVKLAIQGAPYFKAISIELDRPGPSYTIKTVEELKQKYPQHTFSFIIGGDMIDYLPHWHRIDELIKMIQFIGVQRPGAQLTDSPYSKYTRMVHIPQMDISSTIIRDKIRNRKTIRYMVPEEVRMYIKGQGLYES